MDMRPPVARGLELRNAREKLGIARKDLAEALGITEQAIRDLESGRPKDPKIHHATALEDALNIRIRWWAEGKGPMQAAPTMDAYRIALGRRDDARDQKQKRAWERIAAALAKVAMIVLVAVPPYMAPRAEASPFNITSYTMYNRLRRMVLTMFQQLRTYRVAKA